MDWAALVVGIGIGVLAISLAVLYLKDRKKILLLNVGDLKKFVIILGIRKDKLAPLVLYKSEKVKMGGISMEKGITSLDVGFAEFINKRRVPLAKCKDCEIAKNCPMFESVCTRKDEGR